MVGLLGAGGPVIIQRPEHRLGLLWAGAPNRAEATGGLVHSIYGAGGAMTLREIQDLTGARGVPADGIVITGLSADSRTVEPGDLFVAIRGTRHDGHDYVEEAAQAGALAVLLERPVRQVPIPHLEVENSRLALAQLAHGFYGEPTREMTVVGVTGTNGKTTTAHLIGALLGEGAAVLGTLGLRVGDEVQPGDLTTPGALDLAPLLRELVDKGCRKLAMEVSSHGLAQYRVDGVVFDRAVFTNLTRDHLDFHGTFDAYLQAKRRLFEGLGEEGKSAIAIINIDDPAAPHFLEALQVPAVTFSPFSRSGDVRIEDAEVGPAGITARAATPQGPIEVHSRLVGRFNVANLLAGIGVGISLGMSPQRIAEALARVEAVPGRFEVIRGAPFLAVVDYAHTPDALARVLEAARELTAGKVIAVFGCGGDRDAGKRPEMARVAACGADLVVLTSDNPRSEPPEAILDDIEAGMPAGDSSWLRLADRRAAIRRAMELAGPGDLLVVAGKGHEAYQILGDERVPFDDREVVREWIAEQQ